MKIELTEDEFRYFRSRLLTDIRNHASEAEMYEEKIQFENPKYHLYYRSQIKRNKSIVDKLHITLKKFEVLTKDSAIN